MNITEYIYNKLEYQCLGLLQILTEHEIVLSSYMNRREFSLFVPVAT